MIMRAVAWSANRPGLVLAVALVSAIGSYYAQRSLPRDVIPDLSDPQIVLVAEWMGHPAAEVAASVTNVLTAALDGVPKSIAVRGSSMSGMSYVDVVFRSASALAAGRREIAARVEKIRPRLPRNVRVTLGSESSSTGWVLQYALVAPVRHASMDPGRPADPFTTLLELRKFQDHVLRPALSSVPGVAEVASLGGAVEEIRIETTPDELRAAGIALSDVVSTLDATLRSRPSPPLSQIATSRIVVRGLDPLVDPRPPMLEEVARVRAASDMPSGVADVDGGLPAVGGIVIARRDVDVVGLAVQLRQVLDRERRRLPANAELMVVSDRSELARRVERTLVRALAEEGAVVVMVVLGFLLHARSALVPMLTLPLVVLMTLAAMRLIGVPATVMSLGGIGIALGMAVDADLVALEACHRRLESANAATHGTDRRARMVAAAGAFTPPILTSLVIAALAFVPVFAFTGETGRLLRPLALTKTLVIISAALVTLTVAPALRDRLLGGRIVAELDNPLTRILVRAYRPFVHFALARPAFTLVTAGLAALSCLPLIPRLGGEFLPHIDEGDLFFMPSTLPGVPTHEAAMQLARQDRAIRRQPEVRLVFGKVGRADTATDPAPLSMAETTVVLRPRDEWPTHSDRRWYSGWAPAPLASVLRMVWPEDVPTTSTELVERLDQATWLPGWTNAWTTPIRARMDMMATGVRTPVGVRIVAADRARLDALSAAVQTVVLDVPGTKSAVYESFGSETRLVFAPDEAATARFTVNPALVRSTAELLTTGGQVGEIELGGRRARVRLSLAASWPSNPEDLLREATVRSQGPGFGQPVPLAVLGRPSFVTEPSILRTERGELVTYIYVDLRNGTDVLAYVDRARREVERSVWTDQQTRAGERIEWTGQYELIAAGQRRLKLIAPAVAISMLVLLFVQFRSVTEALIVLVSVPFALVGSIWTLYLLDLRLSAPVWVGLLSVVGLAMQTGVVMVVYIDEAFYRRLREGQLRNRDDIVAAHAEGTVSRLRPKLMTIVTMAAGLVPFLWAPGAGAEIMRRVAAPMVGGLVTSAFLTLEVIPVLYTIWRSHQLRRAARVGVPLEIVAGRAPGWARGAGYRGLGREDVPEESSLSASRVGNRLAVFQRDR